MIKEKSPILITGVSGFIGFAVAKNFISKGYDVIGVDNNNDYYNSKLKKKRIEIIYNLAKENDSYFQFEDLKIEEKDLLINIFNKYLPKIVIHLAAQAGVRYSLINPDAYIQSNLLGFVNVLEACKLNKINNLIYASSSSVYGANSKLPFCENDPVNHPVSLYAATKKSNELIAHAYSNLFDIPSTALRFFTVYGPWGRPDMAPMIFANAILKKIPLKVFNQGEMIRDFTYIDDVAEVVFRCALKPAQANINFDKSKPEASSSFAPYRVFNVGSSSPIKLIDFIEMLENAFGMQAIKDFQPMQSGDVVATFSDSTLLENWINFKPSTSFKKGIDIFAQWYLKYHNSNLF